MDEHEYHNDYEITQAEIEADIKAYEQEYGFSSEELLDMRSRGEAPDTLDIGMWLQLLKYRD